MIVSVKNGRFNISSIEYEMMQNITNGLISEKLKYEHQIKELNNFMKEDILSYELEEHKVMLDYISEKHKELASIINDFNSALLQGFD